MRFLLVALFVAVYIYQAELIGLPIVLGDIENELEPKNLSRQLEKTREKINRAKQLNVKGRNGTTFSWYKKGPNTKSYQNVWLVKGDKAKMVKLDDVKIDVPDDVAQEDKEFLKDERPVQTSAPPRKKVYCFVSPDGEICRANKTLLVSIMKAVIDVI